MEIYISFSLMAVFQTGICFGSPFSYGRSSDACSESRSIIKRKRRDSSVIPTSVGTVWDENDLNGGDVAEKDVTAGKSTVNFNFMVFFFICRNMRGIALWDANFEHARANMGIFSPLSSLIWLMQKKKRIIYIKNFHASGS